jgi:hypothetical protein
MEGTERTELADGERGAAARERAARGQDELLFLALHALLLAVRRRGAVRGGAVATKPRAG